MPPIENLAIQPLNQDAQANRPGIGPKVVVAAAILISSSRLFLIIRRSSVNVFFMDQWDFLGPFFHHQASFKNLFFMQLGIQRDGIGLFVDKFLYPLTNWDARVDPFFIGACLFAAMLLTLRLKCKLYGPLAYSDVAIPVTFLTLAQWEMLFNTPDPSYAGIPLLLIILYCLALVRRNSITRYSVVLALNFVLIYTGYGLFMGPITLGVFLLECYWSRQHLTTVPFGQALAGFIVAAASFGSFFIHYEFRPGVGCFQFSFSNLLQYPRFMSLMFSSFLIPRPFLLMMGVEIFGALVLVIVLVVLGFNVFRLIRCPQPARLIGAILLSFTLLFTSNASVGRLCMGLNAAFASRYSTLLIPSFLALYFFLLSKSWLGKRNLVLVFWVFLLLPGSLYKPWWEIHWFSDGKRHWADCYIRTGNIQYCDQSTNFVLFPDPKRTHLQQKLDYLKENRLSFFAEPSR